MKNTGFEILIAISLICAVASMLHALYLRKRHWWNTTELFGQAVIVIAFFALMGSLFYIPPTLIIPLKTYFWFIFSLPFLVWSYFQMSKLLHRDGLLEKTGRNRKEPGADKIKWVIFYIATSLCFCIMVLIFFFKALAMI